MTRSTIEPPREHGADDPRRREPDRASSDGAGDARERISVFEWLVAGLGLVLVLGTIGVLLADARADGPRAPAIAVRADSVTVAGDRFLVHFTARNDGRETAADVGIAGALIAGDSTETSRATLDYLPGRSERRGGLTFAADPRRGTLRLWAEGYQEP